MAAKRAAQQKIVAMMRRSDPATLSGATTVGTQSVPEISGGVSSKLLKMFGVPDGI
jgi:hypothetical protein